MRRRDPAPAAPPSGVPAWVDTFEPAVWWNDAEPVPVWSTDKPNDYHLRQAVSRWEDARRRWCVEAGMPYQPWQLGSLDRCRMVAEGASAPPVTFSSATEQTADREHPWNR